MNKTFTSNCPCGSLKLITECCLPYIDQIKIPETPELLMRSRYTAYTLARIDYIEATMKGEVLNSFNAQKAMTWAKESQWNGLEIIKSSINPDNTGMVEFKAHYQVQQTPYCLYEVGEFQKVDGKWYYVKGSYPSAPPVVRVQPKIGRNEPCPCGSQKKYKKCCGKGLSE